MSELNKMLAAYKQHRAVLDEFLVMLENTVSAEDRVKAAIVGQSEILAVIEKSKSTKIAKITKITKKAKASLLKKDKNMQVSMTSLKPMSLPALSLQIVKESKVPLTFKEVAKMAIERGYKTAAKQFTVSVYQSLNRHVRNKNLSQQIVDGSLKFSA